jgi:hypothetical protein
MKDAAIVFVVCGALLLAMTLAAHVGVARAQAAKSCYEAAKVNMNIKCEPAAPGEQSDV